MELTHIIFDIGNVLVKVDTDKGQKVCEEHFDDFEEGKFDLMRKGVINGVDYWRAFQNGQIGIKEYIETCLTIGGYDHSFENKEAFWNALGDFVSEKYQPMFDLLGHLRGRYTTGVLSNMNELNWEEFEVDVRKVADVPVLSYQIGISKPNEGAYNALLEKLGNPVPSSVLFVDDRIANLEPFEKMGGQTFHFDINGRPMEHAYKDLTTLFLEKGVIDLEYWAEHTGR